MSNGRTYSLNPFDNDDDDDNNMEDTVEFRVMMAYNQRRRPKKDAEPPAQNGPIVENGGSHPKGRSATTEEEEKKKRKGWKRLFTKCIKPQTKDEDPAPFGLLRTGSPVEIPDLQGEEEEEEEFKEVAGRLTAIVKEIPFTPQEIPSAPSDIVTDSPEDEVERLIGLLLREAGDKLNDEELRNVDVPAALFREYSFFERLITTLLERMGLMTAAPDALGPQASPKTQIAVTCEVTSRLSAVDTLPMSRMLNHGARYLQEYYSSWVKQQGGYEEAFHSDDDDDDDDVQ